MFHPVLDLAATITFMVVIDTMQADYVMAFARHIRPHVDTESQRAEAAERRGDSVPAFRHLERTHVLGQASTREHVRVHWHMLLWAMRHRETREVHGQFVRLLGAATKTAFGLVPTGNTGGSDIRPCQRLPVPPDIAATIKAARSDD
ncbi:hypothetical protein PC39_14362 [Salinisphaera sp. PC39]|uniref:DUF3703 domain-containing protein n=1 Tax=Salinisphaera sp. PC39 TaxID=1304156 RepID=UPI00333E430E